MALRGLPRRLCVLQRLSFEDPIIERNNPHWDNFPRRIFGGVEVDFLEVPGPPNPVTKSSFPGHEDLFCSSDHKFRSFFYVLLQKIVQDRPPSRFFRRRYIICKLRCVRSVPFAISGDVGEIKFTLLHSLHGSLELFFCFSGKSDDYIGRYGKKRILGPKIAHLREEILIGVFSIHSLQHCIGAGL